MKSIKVLLTFSFFLLSGYLNISSAQWIQVSNGIGNAAIYSLASSGNNIIAGTQSNGAFISTNAGASWTQTLILNNRGIWSMAVKGNTVVAGSDNDIGVFSSFNNGNTWVQSSLDSMVIYALAASGNVFLAGAEYNNTSMGILRSVDNGASWSQTSLTNRTIRSFLVNGNNIYAGTSFSSGSFGVYLSTDNGSSWGLTSLTGQTVYSLAAIGNNVFAGTISNGIFLSTDVGASWNQTFVPGLTVYSLASAGNNLFAGLYQYGAYLSTNGGANWGNINSGLTFGMSIYSMCIDNNYIYAGTLGQGVWRRPLSEVIPNLPLTLNLTTLIEGFYNSVTNSMVPDTAVVYLQNASSPFARVDSAKSVLSSSGTGTFNFSNAANGTNYYIVVKHRNSIETWSNTAMAFTSGALTYDFTTASNKAFGNNMKQVDAAPVNFALYSGDANQDGYADLIDLSLVFNDAGNFVSGYVATDMNGDNLTDLSDVTITFNNSGLFVSLIRP